MSREVSRWTSERLSTGGWGSQEPGAEGRWPAPYSLFLMSFSSLRMREDSCSGVGASRDSELEASGPAGGVGSRWRKSSSMLLCSLLFSP